MRERNKLAAALAVLAERDDIAELVTREQATASEKETASQKETR